MDNDICDICHSRWLCALPASLQSILSLPLSLSCISTTESDVGQPCWTICPSALLILILSRSLHSCFLFLSLFHIITQIMHNFRFSRSCKWSSPVFSLFLSLSLSHTHAHTHKHSLSPSRSRTHLCRIHASRKICQKYRARKGGEGRKFRNNLHLRTGLIISPLKLASLILSFTSLDFTIHICGPPGRQGGRLSLYNFFTFLSISSF